MKLSDILELTQVIFLVQMGRYTLLLVMVGNWQVALQLGSFGPIVQETW